jgi:hypothetical protein
VATNLSTVQTAFSAWREHQRAAGTKQRYPQALREQAMAMLAHHKPRAVTHALGISDVRVLLSWQQARQNAVPASQPRTKAARVPQPIPAFVDVTPAMLTGTSGLEVELQGADGRRLHIRGAMDPAIIRALCEVALGAGAIRVQP